MDFRFLRILDTVDEEDEFIVSESQFPYPIYHFEQKTAKLTQLINLQILQVRKLKVQMGTVFLIKNASVCHYY